MMSMMMMTMTEKQGSRRRRKENIAWTCIKERKTTTKKTRKDASRLLTDMQEAEEGAREDKKRIVTGRDIQ